MSRDLSPGRAIVVLVVILVILAIAPIPYYPGAPAGAPVVASLLYLFDEDRFFRGAVQTFSIFFGGLILAVVVALIVDAIARQSPTAYRWYRSAVTILAAAPVIAFFPVAMMFLGVNNIAAAIVMVAAFTLFPILDRPDAPAPTEDFATGYYGPVRAVGSAWPQAQSAPQPVWLRLVSLMRAGIGLALTGTIISEIFGVAPAGLGGEIYADTMRLNLPHAVALAIFLTLAAGILAVILQSIERRLREPRP